MEEENELLLKINNQCAVVQSTIAVRYETPEDVRLIIELACLKDMLDEYINHLPQT